MKWLYLKDRKPLYKWSKKGVIILYGNMNGKNLNELYNKDNQLIDHLYNIIDNTDDKYVIYTTKEVIKELLGE